MPKIALMIDGDNISAGYARAILETCESYGDITFRQAYVESGVGNGNWSLTCVPFKQVGSGDNAADFELSFDAIELKEKGKHDTFIIVSNDSDLLHVIQRLKRGGKRVIVVGTDHMSQALKDLSQDIHILTPEVKQKLTPKTALVSCPKNMLETIQDIVDRPDPIPLSLLGDILRKQHKMTPKTLGQKTWSLFFQHHCDLFVLSGPKNNLTVSLRQSSLWDRFVFSLKPLTRRFGL